VDVVRGAENLDGQAGCQDREESEGNGGRLERQDVSSAEVDQGRYNSCYGAGDEGDLDGPVGDPEEEREFRHNPGQELDVASVDLPNDTPASEVVLGDGKDAEVLFERSLPVAGG
jgi:hypothetical protein